MTSATTQIVITAKDATSQAFASANSNLVGLSSHALKAGAALSAIGSGTVVSSMGAFIKSTIDAQDNLFKLSQKTGLAVESLAGLEFAAEQSGVELDKVAKATRVFRELVIESADASSASAKKLAQLGLSYEKLKDLSPEKQLLALSDALSKFSKDDRPVVFTSIFGQKMADLIPLLANGSKELQTLIDQGKKFNPVTEESAKKSEQFNDQINLLNKSVASLGREFVQGMIPGLTAVTDKMVQVTQQSGFLQGALAGVKELFVQSFGNPKILGDVGQIRREIFKTQETIDSLSKKKDSIFFDKNALEHEKEKLVQLENDLQKAIVISREVIAANDANTESTRKFSIALNDTDPVKPIAGIKKLNQVKNDAGRIESEYVKLLVIERKAHEDLLRPYQQSAKTAQERLDSMRSEAQALELSKRSQISLEQAIELTTIARLEERKATTGSAGAIAEIQKEIAARKQIVSIIQNSESSTRQLANMNRIAADETSQLWMQAGRNIQSTLANSIFNFFDDGLDGMVKNVASTVGRIASEFAALRIAQGVGLAGMFGASGAANASSGFSLSSLASGASNLFSSGFGISSALGSVGSALPGAAGAFFSGMGGTGAAAASGAQALWGASGLTGANALGATVGSGLTAVAGPAAIAFAVTQGLKALAGDKRLGGGFGNVMNTIGDIPIIGDLLPVIPLINGLFGRGPLKQRDTVLSGSIGAGGFEDGSLTTNFRAKGGLLRSNKNDFAKVDLVSGSVSTDNDKLQGFADNLSGVASEIATTINSTVKSLSQSATDYAKNLGLSADAVTNYSKIIELQSEKGKMLTEEQIAELLKGIGNELAQGLLPSVNKFRKTGEDSFATLSRLNAEFLTLSDTAIILGKSVSESKDFILSASFEARTGFVDAAGGIEALSNKTKFFADNFLTDSEKIAPAAERLSESMQDIGFSSEITKEQFKDLVQSYGQLNGITAEQLQALLNIAPAFIAVKNAQEELLGTTNTLVKSERGLNDIRQELLSSYGKERNEFESTISKFKSISDRLRDFRDSLSLSELSPLTPGQKLDEARTQFNRTRALAAQGDQSALEDLPSVAQEFLKASQTYNASSSAFISDFNLVKSVLANAENSALSQSEIAQKQLDELKSSVEYLTGIEDATKTTNDLLKELIATTLKGPGNNFTTQQVKDFLAANPNMTPAQVAATTTKYGGSIGQLAAAGYDISKINSLTQGATVTDKQIKDFVASGATPRQIYDASVANGVTSKRLSSVTGVKLSDIEKWVKDNGLPSFAKGTDFISKSGIAMVHRAEAIVPSSTTEEIKKLREELAMLRREQQQQTGDLIKVTDITNKQNAQIIAQALTVIESKKQWNDRSKARLA